MITIENFLKLIDYKITEGSLYLWKCYGDNVYRIDSDNDSYSLSILFDTKNQTVYEVTACDLVNDRAYRMINPEYIKQHKKECKIRGIHDTAWDSIEYTDLELDEDFTEKARAIFTGDKYSTDILVPLTLPDDEMLVLYTMAHERNMTFNEFITDVLTKEIAIMSIMTKKELKMHKKKYMTGKSIAKGTTGG